MGTAAEVTTVDVRMNGRSGEDIHAALKEVSSRFAELEFRNLALSGITYQVDADAETLRYSFLDMGIDEARALQFVLILEQSDLDVVIHHNRYGAGSMLFYLGSTRAEGVAAKHAVINTYQDTPLLDRNLWNEIIDVLPDETKTAIEKVIRVALMDLVGSFGLANILSDGVIRVG